MGNLTNPVSLRLRLNIYWNSLWVSYIDNNYSFLLSSDFLLYSYIRWFTYRKIFLTFGWLFYYSHFKIFRLFDKIYIIFFFKDYKFYKFFFEYVYIILKLNNSLHKRPNLGIYKNIKLLNNFHISKSSLTPLKLEKKKKTYLNFCWLFIFFDLQKVFYTLSFNQKTKTMDKIYIYFQNIFFLTNFMYLFFIYVFVVCSFFVDSVHFVKFNVTKKFAITTYSFLFFSLYFIYKIKYYTWSFSTSTYGVVNPVSFFNSLNVNYQYFFNRSIICNIKERRIFSESFGVNYTNILNNRIVFVNPRMFFFKKLKITKMTFSKYLLSSIFFCYKVNFVKKKNKTTLKFKNLIKDFTFFNVGLIYFKFLTNLIYSDKKQYNFNSFVSSIFKKVSILRRDRKRMRTYKYILWLRRIVKRAIKLLHKKSKFITSRFYFSFFSFSSKWIIFILKQFLLLKKSKIFCDALISRPFLFNSQTIKLFTFNNVYDTTSVTKFFSVNNYNIFFFIKLYYHYYFKHFIFLRSMNKYKIYFYMLLRIISSTKTVKFLTKSDIQYKKAQKTKIKNFIWKFFNTQLLFTKKNLKNKFLVMSNNVVRTKISYINVFKIFINTYRNKITRVFFSFTNLLRHRRLVFSYFNKKFKKYLLTWKLSRFNSYSYLYNNLYSFLCYNTIYLKYTFNRAIKITCLKFKQSFRKDLSFFFNQFVKLNSISVYDPCILNNNLYQFFSNSLNNYMIIVLLRKLKNILLYSKYYLYLFVNDLHTVNHVKSDDLIVSSLKNFSSLIYYLNLFLKYLNILGSTYNNIFITHYFIILKKSIHLILVNIADKDILLVSFKYFYQKFFEFFSFFFSSFKEIFKYRLFFAQTLSLLTYISKNFNFNNVVAKISLQKKTNIYFLKKKVKINFVIRKRFSKYFYCQNFLEFNKKLLLYKFKLLSFFLLKPASCSLTFNNSAWFLNLVKVSKLQFPLIFLKKNKNVSKLLFNKFSYIVTFFNMYFFKKFYGDIRLFYMSLLSSFHKNYMFFFKVSTLWKVCKKNIYYNFNNLNLRASYILNIVLYFIFIWKKFIVNSFYSNFKFVYNSINFNLLLFYHSFNEFLNKEITVYVYSLKKRNIFNNFIYIYKYFFLMFKQHFVTVLPLKKNYKYFFFLKHNIFSVYFNLFLHNVKYTNLLYLCFINNTFIKIILITFFKNYYKQLIFYMLTRYWFFNLIFRIAAYNFSIKSCSFRYWKIFFSKFFSLKEKNMSKLNHWSFSIYLYNTFKFPTLLKKHKLNFWFFDKYMNLNIFFFKAKRKKKSALTTKNFLFNNSIFNKNIKFRKFKYLVYIKTLKKKTKSKLYIYVLKNLLQTLLI